MFPEHLHDNRIPFFSEDIFHKQHCIASAFVEKNYNIGMHAQEFYEINIVLRGTGCHYINDNRIDVNEGYIFIIPPNIMHGYAGKDGFNVFHLLISREFLSRHISDFYTLPSFSTLFDIEPTLRARTNFVPSLILNGDKLEEITALTDLLLRYNKEKDDNKSSALLLNSYAEILIIKLCEAYGSTVGASPEKQSFMESLALIYNSYSEKITVKQLADTALMSRSAYIRQFCDLFGTTPIDFLIRRRIMAAKELLTSTRYPLEKIAELTGFHDASHLIRVFTKSESMSPTEFRKRN